MTIRINNVKMFLVYSSNVFAVGYDASEEELYVLYKSGGLYAYKNVAMLNFFAIFIKESVGNYIAKEIKPKYPARKVDTVSFNDFAGYIRQYIADE